MSSRKPLVLGLALDYHPPTHLADYHGHLLSAVRDKTDFRLFHTNADKFSVADAVAGSFPDVVLVLDGGVSGRNSINGVILDLLKSYAEKNGSRIVFCALFSSLKLSNEMDRVFMRCGLEWKVSGEPAGRKEENVLNLKAEAGAELRHWGLAEKYKVKAVYVNVTEKGEVVYGPKIKARVESTIRAVAAWKRVGNSGGGLGYVGDMYGEEQSTAIVMAMCGLS